MARLADIMAGESIAKVLIVGVLVAIVSSLIPARQIARVDPVSAFHE